MNIFQESLVIGQITGDVNRSDLGLLIFNLLICIVGLIGLAATFDRAGRPAWAAFVPVGNLIVLLQIARKPNWWILLFLIPVVNLFVLISVSIALARTFGKGAAFGWGLVFLAPVFYLILGFGDALYNLTTVADSPDCSGDPKRNLRDLGVKIINNYQGRRINVGFARQSHIDDDSLPALAGLGLHELYLSRTEITDASLEDLKTMQTLQVLDVMHTNLSRDGITQLKESLPNAKIVG